MYEKFQWYVHVIFVFIHKKMIREEGKNLEFTSSDEDSFLICVPCAPADAFFHHLPLEIDAKLILLTTEK